MRAHAVARPRPSRRAHASSRLHNLCRMRAPQDEDDHRLRHSSPCQTAHLVPAPALLRPGFASLLHSPQRGVGGAPRDVRVLGGAPVGHAMTRRVRRLARRLASHDAGRSPLGAPPWRFWAPGAALLSPLPPSACASAGSGSVTASSSQPGRSAWRAGSLPPGAAVTSRYRRTPLPAPPSGSPPETPLYERGCESMYYGCIL